MEEILIRIRNSEENDTSLIQSFMKALYEESKYDRKITQDNMKSTFSALKDDSNRGNILVIEKDDEIIGYAIVINYWSNEYGGNILHLDEIYIIPSNRHQGVGSQFMRYLIDSHFNNAVMIQIEVTKINQAPAKLYHKLGFKWSSNSTMHYEFKL
jgi:ribosomal protein S18 acetylase RimI-like enzyme